MPRLRELAVIALVAAAAATQLPLPGWNAGAHYALLRSVVDGSPSIDRHLNQSGDIAYVDGHFYAAKSPGLAFLSVPVYLAFDAVGAVPATYVTGQGPPSARQVSERAIWQVNLVVIAALFALLVLVRSTAEAMFPGTGLAVALILGLGTMLLPFATVYFAHDVSALFSFAAFVLLLRERQRPSRRLVAGAGALAGLSVFAELPTAVIAACLGVYAVVDGPRVQRGLAYVGGFLVGVLPLAAFNAWAFGSPLRNGYSSAVKELGTTGHDLIGANGQGFFGLTYPHLHAAFDLLFSERGLFLLTPVTLVAVAGLFVLARHGARREALFIAGLALAMLVYNSAYYLPFGGHVPGPRFLVPLLPFLSLPLAAAYSRWRVATLAAGALSAFWMIAATVGGPLLPTDVHVTTWLGNVVHARGLAGSIFGNGRTAEIAFLLPAALAVLIAIWASRTAATRAA